MYLVPTLPVNEDCRKNGREGRFLVRGKPLSRTMPHTHQEIPHTSFLVHKHRKTETRPSIFYFVVNKRTQQESTIRYRQYTKTLKRNCCLKSFLLWPVLCENCISPRSLDLFRCYCSPFFFHRRELATVRLWYWCYAKNSDTFHRWRAFLSPH